VCYKGVTRELPFSLPSYLSRAIRPHTEYPKCYRGVTEVLQGCYRGVTGVLQGCYRGVTGVLKAYLVGLLQNVPIAVWRGSLERHVHL
jgi:hypothetical protein